MSQIYSDFPVGLQLWPQARRKARSLQEGYAFSLLEKATDTYHFTVAAGIGQVLRIFQEFAAGMPEEAFFILEFYTTDPAFSEPSQNTPTPSVYYSPYLPVTELFAALSPYWDRLLHDGFVGFGLANNRASLELFYSEEKILTCFTDNHIRLTDLMSRIGLPHRKDLPLHTDLGHDHLSLLCLKRSDLPEELQGYSERELDYAHFCREVVETLGMYPVEESISFFFSRKEQMQIEDILRKHPEFEEFAEEEFGTLLLDWHDFVSECSMSFEGDLWEYRQGLRLRDMIQHVIEATTPVVADRITEALEESDERFRQSLIDHRKRLDNPGCNPAEEDRFWHQGVIRNAGVDLRRDLIRCGWYKP
ncbi:MAG TPA: hypothetical protein VJ910_15050 [Desulfuromonadales bacterium]|nr:hypothetical protein [Desulfuromonadales bacterium]